LILSNDQRIWNQTVEFVTSITNVCGVARSAWKRRPQTLLDSDPINYSIAPIEVMGNTISAVHFVTVAA
jgi:hypothetical protein